MYCVDALISNRLILFALENELVVGFFFLSSLGSGDSSFSEFITCFQLVHKISYRFYLKKKNVHEMLLFQLLFAGTTMIPVRRNHYIHLHKKQITIIWTHICLSAEAHSSILCVFVFWYMCAIHSLFLSMFSCFCWIFFSLTTDLFLMRFVVDILRKTQIYIDCRFDGNGVSVKQPSKE